MFELMLTHPLAIFIWNDSDVLKYIYVSTLLVVEHIGENPSHSL
jgi:hypothetical protein